MREFNFNKKQIVLLVGFLAMAGGLATSIGIGSSIWQDYRSLKQDYRNLEDRYNDLFSDYQSLLSILEDPLTSPVVPTYSQVFSWLATDDTDDHSYTPNWMCGDFATMLMVRAKEQNWRMRIACMFYSFSGEYGYGDDTDPYGSNGHAFNVILCQDYNGDYVDDWFYIEPQTDAIWYVVIDSVPFIHYEIHKYMSGGISGTVWDSTYWVNHYSYFA